MTSDTTINFLTLNCWGIPIVSKNKNARIEAIAEKLVKEEYDIICLQEVWSVDDFKVMKAKTQERLPYAHYFHSGVFGSGICILSRYRIEDVMFHKWPLNGYVHKIHHADWFGGKGIGLCKIRIQDMNVNVYIAHLHAEYSQTNDEYMAHRVLQAFDTAQFIRMTSGGCDAVILGGDLNTEPQDLAYKIICGVAGLIDACSNSSNNLGTNECANNSYTSSRISRKCPEGKRIDHILYFGSSNCKVEVTNFHHPFPSRVPCRNFSYSDHEAVMATFKFSPGQTTKPTSDAKDSLKEAIEICKSALRNVRRQRFWYLFFGCLLIIPLIWSMELDYVTKSVGLHIGLNIARIILTAIGCYALFVMGFIWNKVEQNALKAGNLAMEIQLLRLSHRIN